jgi:predicted dehydrogenase
MKQLLQNLRTGETEISEVPVPTPKPGMALVRTSASLVSAGTERTLVEFAGKSLLGKARSRPDLARQVLDKARREGLLTTVEAAFNRLDQPMPLGYSSSGTIVALGEEMEGFQTGQRVACAGGGYAVHAEYNVVPKNLLALLPQGVDHESAAFTTLGSIALHGFRLAEIQLGERVAVIGLGLLGQLAVGIASAAGCRVLGVDLDPRRVRLAEEMGAQAVIRDEAQEAAQSFSRGQGCDAVLICADTPSSDPVELAGEIARDRARVVALGAVGLHIPRKIYYEKELSFVNSRSYGPGRYDPSYEEGGQEYPIGYVRWTEGRNLEAFVDLLASGRIDVTPLITHRFPIEDAPEAYRMITSKTKEHFVGVLLTYPHAVSPGETAGIETGRTEAEAPVNEAQLPATVEKAATVKSREPERINLGVLGAGNFATAVLLPALKKVHGIHLVGVASPSGLSARHASDRFGFEYAASDEGDILRDENVNTLAVLTRHHLHVPQVVAGLETGRHVFCEKPLAITPEGLEQVRTVLAGFEDDDPKAVPMLMVGFNRRFAPLAQELMAFIQDRQEPLVAHYRVNAGSLPLTHWLHDPNQGGGRIIGEGCHFVDFLTYLVGEPPVSVCARALADLGVYREDNVIMTFSFPDGSLGTVSYLANGDKAFPKERVEVFTAGKVAVLDDYRSLEMASDGRRRVSRSRLRQDKGHRQEWEAFSQAILKGEAPPIPYAHLFGVAQATFAALDSLRGGESVDFG